MIVTGESTNLPSATSSRKRREAQLAYDEMDKFDREKYANKDWEVRRKESTNDLDIDYEKVRTSIVG